MLVASAVAAAMRAPHAPAEAARFVVAVPTAVAIAKLLKHVVSEHRPRLFDKSPEQSFPSGHTTAATAFALATAASSQRWWAYPIAGAVIGAVALGRVRAREHWPRDVVAGVCIGAVGASLGALAAKGVRALTSALPMRKAATTP